MSGYCMSINQIAEFKAATDNGKRRLIAQQLIPNRIKIPYYQLAKARIRRSVALKGDLAPIYDGINTLIKRVSSDKRQETLRTTSIEALERFIRLKIPEILTKMDFTVIKPKIRSTKISEVDVIVAPEVVVLGELNGQKVVGAVKIHVSKGKPFDYHQAKIVATGIHAYLKNCLEDGNTIALPELCFCIDVFGGTAVSAAGNYEYYLKELESICDEIVFVSKAA